MPLLYDHGPVGSLEALCRDIQNQIDNGNCRMVDLLDVREKAEQKPKIFQKENGVWKSGQYIGLLEYEGKRVTITSRFDERNPQPFFLWYLMENFLGESMISLESISGTYEKSFFDQLLAVRMAVRIQQAFKKGGLRAYQSFCRNDTKISGVMDIPRHIRENLDLDNSRMAYRTQAYSLHNHWNILFLQADALACRRFPDLMRRLKRRLPEYSAALRTLSQAAPSWEEARLSQVLSRTEQRLSNPIYRDCEPVRQAARAILRRLGTDLGKGGTSAVTGVFLDMDRLWERLLEDMLFSGAEKPFSQQSRLVLNGHMLIRPDFYFPNPRMVLDAKNRPVWEMTLPSDSEMARESAPGHFKAGSPEGKWSERTEPPDAIRDNVYQVLSYMLALNCSQGGIVFPSHNRHSPVRDPIGPLGLYFWRIPVCIPQAEKYQDFRNLLEKEFLRLRRQAPVCGLLT